jgi:AcrR family transcriptional regulator
MAKPDRRVQRTRDLLQKALLDLIGERKYDTITIQEIVDRANVARTTFYVHYTSKDDLFLSCHDVFVSGFIVRPLYHHPLSLLELISPEVPDGLVQAFRHLEEVRPQLTAIFQGKDGAVIVRSIRDWSARELSENLKSVLPTVESTSKVELLAIYIAGAQIALVQWWLEKRQPYDAQEVAHLFHRMQRAAIRDAFGLE